MTDHKLESSTSAEKTLDSPISAQVFEMMQGVDRNNVFRLPQTDSVLNLFPRADSIIACGGSTYDGKLTDKIVGAPAISGFSKEELKVISQELKEGISEVRSTSKSDTEVSEKLVGLLQKLFPGKDKIVIAPDAGSPELTIHFSPKQGKSNLFTSNLATDDKLLVTTPDGKKATFPLNSIRFALRDGVKPQSNLRGCGLEPAS